ncbi:MAG: threonylcarbamoyl-AMP synthase [Deltaproteobacteria bacterium]|nr:threonylcarbamoyl-AMP synthase [Deltaproteobacteria bacterium]
MLLPINPEHPEPRKIERAVQILEQGGVIGYPTDTVYGLGCDLTNKQAIGRLHQMKAMPRNKRLSFVCPDLGDIARYAVVDNATYRILKRFLPGPYCFVLRASREVPKMVPTRQNTVGIRVPDHAVAQALVRALGRPIISTTARLPDGPPLQDPWEIEQAFPALDLVLATESAGGEPATVVDLSDGQVRVLRHGAGPVEGLA